MKRLIATVLLALAPVGPGWAAEANEPPERASTLIVYGNDPCPRSEGEEIVVCARRSENDRYRIPKELRDEGREPSETSFASQFAGLEEVTRFTRPNSCSPVGTFGQTGCFDASIRRWRSERQALEDEEYQP